jgi:SAM-dependent methyltransferase
VTERPQPFILEAGGEAKRIAPATQRNREAITSVLRDILPAKGVVLEVASGTGEHVVHFAAAFPDLTWQPSDYDLAGLASIEAWSSESGLPNILSPLRIDASAADWPLTRAEAIICINMAHIAPWEASEGLFAGAARLLAPGAPLYLYGPYREAGVATAESNEAFDVSLKARNPAWGLRSVEQMNALAAHSGFALEARVEMPANNLSLFYKRFAD